MTDERPAPTTGTRRRLCRRPPPPSDEYRPILLSGYRRLRLSGGSACPPSPLPLPVALLLLLLSASAGPSTTTSSAWLRVPPSTRRPPRLGTPGGPKDSARSAPHPRAAPPTRTRGTSVPSLSHSRAKKSSETEEVSAVVDADDNGSGGAAGKKKKTRKKVRGKKAKKRDRAESGPSGADGGGGGEVLCIRFSRTFQRHVVYRPRRGRATAREISKEVPAPSRKGNTEGAGRKLNSDEASSSSSSTSSSSSSSPSLAELFCRYDDGCDEVVASYAFLDEAMEAHPSARIVRLDLVAVERDEDDPKSVVAGMGTVPTNAVARIVMLDGATGESKGGEVVAVAANASHLLKDGHPNGDPAAVVDDADSDDALYVRNATQRSALERRGRGALRYLSGLTASFASQAIRDPKQIRGIEDRISSVLERRVGLRRFMSHDLGSIRRNYIRVADLLTRGREHRTPTGGTIGEEDAVLSADGGLAFTEAAVRNLVSSFPEICLYEYREVEERVKFLTAPLPPPEEVEGLLSEDSMVVGNGAERRKRGRKPGGSGTKGGGGGGGIDWPRLSWEGYGAGLTIDQATAAVRAVPNLLALHHIDARKPALLYFYRELQVDPTLCREAERLLGRQFVGTDPSDAAAFAYLRGLGASWDSIRLLVNAFPVLTSCDVQTGWELINEGPVRRSLDEGMMVYMRKRLQIGAGELFHMMKTHSRLSLYSVRKNMSKLHAFQSRLGISSSQLRSVILRMPSLLGMGVDDEGSPSALQKRLDFFLIEAGMTKDELRTAILKQPSLLHYSVASLRTKMQFLTDELCIPDSFVSRIISTAPAFMGLSLSGNLRPTVDAIMEQCDLSPEQVGEIVTTSPPILTLSLKRKIEPCLSFLIDALQLSSKRELGVLVTKVPRVLIQSIESSLVHKMHLLQEAITEENKMIGAKADSGALAALLLVRNPSLLVTTNNVLAKRLRTCLDDPDTSLSVALEPKSSGRKKMFATMANAYTDAPSRANTVSETDAIRKRKSVLELSPDSDNVLGVFSSVKDVAKCLGVSESRVYSTCRQQGKLLKGRRFVYADMDPPTQAIGWQNNAVWKQGTRMIVIEPLQLFDDSTPDPPTGNVSIVCFTSGQVFPSDNKNTVRGTYQTGGMAVYFPQALSGRKTLAAQLRVAAKSSWGLIIPEAEGGYSFNSGCIMADFTPLNPSRNRCELCSCELALKVILNLLKQAASTTSLGHSDVHIDVYTSSFYAWRLLKDSQRLLRWGASPRLSDFVYDGDGPSTLANPDLLHPLAVTYARLKRGELSTDDGQKICFANNVEISFHHSADAFPGRTYEGFAKRIDDYARRAAVWAFERERNAILN